MQKILENTPPYKFLKDKLGKEPSRSDLELLEYLVVDKKLKPSAVNLLIDYVYLTHNKFDVKLIKKYASYFK